MKGIISIVLTVITITSAQHGFFLGNILSSAVQPTAAPAGNVETITFDPSSPPHGHVELQKINMTAQEIIQAQGYPNETHTVNTPDNYTLTIVRIPRPGAIPVYVLHGVLCSCRDFLVQPGNKSLAFQLYDAGFDVWLGNIRGNDYSSGHLYYNSSDPKYWEYWIDHISAYDNPTAIDYVLAQTGQPQLIWIGYSLGTLSFFGTMASKPEYNAKIIQFVGLAPLISQGYSMSPLVAPAIVANQVSNEAYLTGGPLVPSQFMPFLGMGLPEACKGGNIVADVGPGICAGFLSFLLGPDGNETNRAVLPVAFKEFPNQVSVYVVRQLYQDTRDPEFRYYDFGSTSSNQQAYGADIPPKYNTTKITAPCILYGGSADSLVAPKDVDKLANALPCPPRRRSVTNFNHIDFVYGRHAPELYQIVIQDLLNLPDANKQLCA